MPWISTARLRQLETAAAELPAMRVLMHGLALNMEDVPRRTVEAFTLDVVKKAARTMDTLEQPLSLGAADKLRVREQREKEQDQR